MIVCTLFCFQFCQNANGLGEIVTILGSAEKDAKSDVNLACIFQFFHSIMSPLLSDKDPSINLLYPSPT